MIARRIARRINQTDMIGWINSSLHGEHRTHHGRLIQDSMAHGTYARFYEERQYGHQYHKGIICCNKEEARLGGTETDQLILNAV